MEKFYTVKEVAELLGYATQTVYNKIYNTKEINAVRLPSGKIRITEEEIRRITSQVKDV